MKYCDVVGKNDSECQEIWPLSAELLATSVILETSLNLCGPQFSCKIGKENWIKVTQQSLMNFYKLIKTVCFKK